MSFLPLVCLTVTSSSAAWTAVGMTTAFAVVVSACSSAAVADTPLVEDPGSHHAAPA